MFRSSTLGIIPQSIYLYFIYTLILLYTYPYTLTPLYTVVWESINSQSRHSHSRRSTSWTQLSVTDRLSIRQSKTLGNGQSPIINAPRPSIIQSAQRLTLFQSVQEYVSTNHFSSHLSITNQIFPRPSIFETVRDDAGNGNYHPS